MSCQGVPNTATSAFHCSFSTDGKLFAIAMIYQKQIQLGTSGLGANATLYIPLVSKLRI
ncbi:hypothetical protein TUMEXPCC7403_10305 [Tumidithrix helvetica PCC 7403]|uniref:Uncharacterized protein n=1 Tax=Tumidithrix elongata BACA0141 TaxID=2716417 RepID=A0AAW9Q5L0_9CYAN|nr:hypothetical protein [Tumidithrix elongata RA019]